MFQSSFAAEAICNTRLLALGSKSGLCSASVWHYSFSVLVVQMLTVTSLYGVIHCKAALFVFRAMTQGRVSHFLFPPALQLVAASLCWLLRVFPF